MCSYENEENQRSPLLGDADEGCCGCLSTWHTLVAGVCVLSNSDHGSDEQVVPTFRLVRIFMLAMQCLTDQDRNRFLPGIVTIQIVSIFFPILDAIKLKQLESRVNPDKQPDGADSLFSEKSRNPYSMDCLELSLKNNPQGLLNWVSTKEFTAENIMFLTQVHKFKRQWGQVAKHTDALDELQLRERYEEAALIWFTLVNARTARMNINIDYKTYSELEIMFKGLSYDAFSDDSSSCSKGSSTCTNVVAPFLDQDPPEDDTDRPASSNSRQSNDSKAIGDSEVDKLYRIPVTEISSNDGSTTEDTPIPPNFSIDVFDRAYAIVKNDVYYNTWVRFDSKIGGRPHSPTRQRGSSFLASFKI